MQALREDLLKLNAYTTFTTHCISLTMLNKEASKLHGGCPVTQASSVGLSVSGELR